MKKRLPRTIKIVVLNDHRTFTDLEGCQILEVPRHWSTEQIEYALGEGEGEGEDGRKIKVIQTW